MTKCAILCVVQINHHAVRALRERTGVSQATLAADAGIDRTHLVRIENGERGASDPQIIALAKALRVTISAITHDPIVDEVA